MVVLGVDLFTGYSKDDYDNKKRVSFQEYTKIKNDTLSDSLTKVWANRKIVEIYNSEDYSPLLLRAFLKVKNSFIQPSKNVPQIQNVDIKSTYNDKYSINSNVELFSYKFLSSAWLMLFLMISLNMFFIATYKNIFEAIYSSIVLSIVLLSIAIFISNLCNMIPIIHSIYVNYALNFFIGIIFPLLIFLATGNLAYQYESYLEDNQIVMPNVDDYDNLRDYLKARINASRIN